ncbi:transcriptional repressor [candidate division KSB1 bacterium]|nr:transcriptional repressor [candidate division KSB1 bacterium]
MNNLKYQITRHSVQRDRILELLRSTDRHPTADWLYDKLKSDFPRLSLGTIYRNLAILHEQGLIRKISFGSAFDRFEARVDHHYHLVCEECGRIMDLAIPFDEELNKKANASAGTFQVRHHRLEFYGLCENCRSQKDK